MSNVARHDETTTNHMEVLTNNHWGIETFFGLRDEKSLVYFMKYSFQKKSKSEMCSNLMFDTIFSFAFPTGKFPL